MRCSFARFAKFLLRFRLYSNVAHISLERMNSEHLLGRTLDAIWLLRTPVHPAWKDATTPEICSGFVNLAISNASAVQILPCEVDASDQYPSLGIELLAIDHVPHLHRWVNGVTVSAEILTEMISSLPATITHIRMWDSMGEGPVSAVDFVLSTGVTLTIRHIFPPMTLGIDLSIMQDAS